MNQEMKNRLLRLNSEALVEILESVCGYAEIELNFGQDPADCINEPVFYAYEPHCGSWTVLNYDPAIHDRPKHNIDMAKDHEHLVRVEAPYCEMCDTLSEAIETGHITAYEVIQSPALKQKQDNGCGCYQDPPCRGCAEEQREQLFLTDHEKDIEELKLKLDILRQQRDEAIIHANNIIREARTPIMSAGKHTGGYWNAVDNFRRFESKTT